MEPQILRVEGFEFRVGELDGYRLIDVVFPPRPVSSRLAMCIEPFFSLWDDDEKTVQILDVSQCEGLDETAHEYFKLTIRRTIHQPGYTASAWVVGDNAQMADDLERLLFDAMSMVQGVFKTRAEAVEFVRYFMAAE